jgi:two-component system KDP operon response regulator KdpE
MPGRRILLIDAEAATRRLLHALLTQAGFQVTLTASGYEGLEQAALLAPAAILLDLRPPDIHGLELCRELRRWSATPIIVLSINDNVQLKVQALNLGADDCITKPFDADEVIARLRAILRRTGREAVAPILETGALRLDQVHRRVTVAGRAVPVTPTEYELLSYLMIHAGKVITYPALLRVIWGDEYTNAYATLRVFIAQLRRKIEPDLKRPRYIVTVPRVGYRLSGPA